MTDGFREYRSACGKMDFFLEIRELPLTLSFEIDVVLYNNVSIALFRIKPLTLLVLSQSGSLLISSTTKSFRVVLISYLSSG